MRFRIGESVLDLERGTFHRAGALVTLRPKTFDLLSHLVRNPERLLTKDELLAAVWPKTIVTENSLTQCIRDARKSIGDDRQQIIRTVQRRGYLFRSSDETAPDSSTEGTERPGEPMVAVFPFRSATAGASQLPIQDGLAEEIAGALSRFKTVTVFSHHSAFALAKAVPQELQSLAERYGIDYLVEGTVEDTGEGVRVTISVSEAISGRRVWTHSFPFAPDGVLTVPAMVARNVITALATNIEGAAMRRAVASPARNVAAYVHLQRGISFLRSYGPTMNEQARDHFLAAIDLDPESGLAYAYLALAETIIAGYGAAQPEILATARDTALRAAALAPDEARCHRILGLILLYSRDFEASERHYDRALDINPYDADTLIQKGHLLAMRGNPQAGIELADRAVQLNPLHPVWYHFDRAEILFALRRYREAAEALSSLPRKDAWHMARLSAAYAMQGDLRRAAASVAEGRRLAPSLKIEEILCDVASGHPEGLSHMREALERAGWPKTA